MTAISAVSTQSRPTIEEPKNAGWTEVKVKQAWLNAVALLSFVGSGVALGAAIAAAAPLMPLAGVGLPLAAFGGGLLIYSRSLIDYDDPAVLNGLRREALGQPLLQIVEKHTWEKLFRYEILSESGFDAAYRAHADTLSFKAVVSLHNEAQRGLRDAGGTFQIPSPRDWKRKFELETKGMRCDRILDLYSLDDLKHFQIISSDQAQALDRTAKAKHSLQRVDSELEQQFRDRTPYQHGALRNAVDLAELSFRSHPVHLALSQLEADEERNVCALRDCIRAKIRQEECATDTLKSHLNDRRGGCLTQCDLQEISSRESQRDCAIRNLRSEEWSGVSQIRQEAAMRRIPLQHTLSIIRDLKMRSIAAAEEQFRFATLPVRQEIDAKHAENRAQYEQAVTELDKMYRS